MSQKTFSWILLVGIHHTPSTQHQMGDFYVERPTAPPLSTATSLDPSTGFRQSDIAAAFKLFDKDGDGTIDKAELFAILTRSGSNALAAEDARALIAEFDTNGDGVLSLSEFTAAISDSAALGAAVRESEAYANDLYDRRAAPHMNAIKALFNLLDVDGSGHLTVDELKEAVAFYEGAAFDEDLFLQWYDTNHAIEVERLGALRTDQLASAGTADGQLDLTEFSWYLVEMAGADELKMGSVVEGFRDAIEYVAAKKKDRV